MFNKLKEKWKVSWWQFALIFTTFALGGSLCGYAGEEVLSWMNISVKWLRVPVYILVVTILWPLCVLLISIPFGQFAFFRAYIRKIAARFTGNK
ncbi:MAG: hypothetical protein ABR95_01045 [Sphingobacteriales bacterium BACL12 MAG-120813-bin55]|jgi:hypothetical protein|nr:MAG: hypothetical protein ABR95_01045 [Sphingobacteriales bacterium BACL12 MAG-120813-bin55]